MCKDCACRWLIFSIHGFNIHSVYSKQACTRLAVECLQKTWGGVWDSTQGKKYFEELQGFVLLPLFFLTSAHPVLLCKLNILTSQFFFRCNKLLNITEQLNTNGDTVECHTLHLKCCAWRSAVMFRKQGLVADLKEWRVLGNIPQLHTVVKRVLQYNSVFSFVSYFWAP